MATHNSTAQLPAEVKHGQTGEQPLLRFDHVSVAFQEGDVLRDVSFDLWPSETRIILGAAGSGKSVLLKTAIGLLHARAGRVWLFGQDITDMEEHELFPIRSRVGVLFQEGGLFDSLTIAENVAYPLLNQQSRGESRMTAEVESKVEEALRFVELEKTLDKFPS